MSRILVVEDESAIAELIAINLRHAGHEITLAASAEQAQREVDAMLPDLVVLDWMLPGQSGLALARQWRADARTKELPIILLTARAAEQDKVSGLDAGADDYLTKPFSTNELMARIRAVLRRKVPEALDEAVEIAGLKLDPATRRVSHRDRELKLGPPLVDGAGVPGCHEPPWRACPLFAGGRLLQCRALGAWWHQRCKDRKKIIHKKLQIFKITHYFE